MTLLNGVRILLIEDNADLAENLIEILEDEDAVVELASSAMAARVHLEHGFDIALLDVNLPDANGLSLLTELKKSGDGLSEVVLISGFATIENAIEAVGGGAYAYILKPFRVEDIVATVERAWRQVRSSRKEHRLARALEKREADLRALVEAVQALLIVLDTDGHVRQANPSVTALTGIAIAQLIGQLWDDAFLSANDSTALPWQTIFLRLIESDEPVSLESRVPTTHSSDDRIVSWRFTLVDRGAGEQLIYASGLDVTEFKTLEQRSQLAQRLAAVGTLAAGLAHEIRNPLNSAQLQLRLLERRIRKLSDESRVLAPIGLVQHEIQRLSDLVQEFLSFARPAVLSIDECNLVELAERVVNMEQAAAKSAAVDMELHAEGPVLVQVDVNKIQQVLLNLVRNAVEAVSAIEVSSRRVDVEVEQSGSGAVIHVRDNGIGMPAEVKARIFEPFFSTKQSGTGLGMAICHSLVTQHGGDMFIHSEPDEGADIEVRLPHHPPVAAARARQRTEG